MCQPKCPQQEVITPCKCNHDSKSGVTIICGGTEEIKLKTVFKRISETISERNFDTLIINNTKIKEIEADVFGDTSFKNVFIREAKSLGKINSDAFIKTSHFVKQLVLDSSLSLLNSHPHPYDLFDLVNSLENLQILRMLYPSLNTITSQAFKLKKLTNLEFGEGNDGKNKFGIGSIEDEAFSSLDSLKFLNLRFNKLSQINDKTFSFNAKSTQRLDVDLTGNLLTHESFSEESLLNFNRPVDLTLSNNEIKEFDPLTFKKFLDDPFFANKLWLKDVQINCNDCRNHWLYMNKDKYQNSVYEAYCYNNKNDSIFTHKWDNC